MSASGVDKAKRKRRLGLLRIRGRQNPQTQSPQTRTMGRGEKRAFSQGTGVTVAVASIGAVEEFPEGKPYRVDEGPNAARKRVRDTIAPLNKPTHCLRTH